MTIRLCLSKYRKDETELLLAHLLNYSQAELYTHPEKTLTKTQTHRLENMISQARQGIPIAYILGYKYFLGNKFKVNRSVLIPRPESEWLVETALKLLNKRAVLKPKVLDVGTGSGCLGISLKQKMANADVTLADISKRALAVAEYNAQNHNVKTKLVHSNLLSNVRGTFDIIFANLPYVPESDYRKFYGNLKYEPKLALIGKQHHPLYRKFLSQLVRNLSDTGITIMELDPSTVPVIENWLKQNPGLYSAKFMKDLHGLWRYCTIAKLVKADKG